MMMNIGKNLLITSDNQKKSVHYVNLLKLIPEKKSGRKFKLKHPILKSRNIKIFYPKQLNNESKNENDESQNIDKITQINLSTLDKNTPSTSLSQKNIRKLNINDIQTTNTNNYLNKNKIKNDSDKKKINKDKVFSFFNRNFYECNIPLSKKAELNQKILNYLIQDKETKEKYQRIKLEELMAKKYRRHTLKNIVFSNEKKNDIKKSLLLNDFTIYHKIHKVLRFWGKFTNFACPIFQVQKYSLSSKKFNNEKIHFSLENIDLNKNNLEEKKLRLPVLYTNSSRTIEKFGNKKYRNMTKNRSDLELNEFNFNNSKKQL